MNSTAIDTCRARTSVTDEPITAGRFGRVQTGCSGRTIVYITDVTERGAVARELDEDGARWHGAHRIDASDILDLLSPLEVRAARLPPLP